MHKIAVLGDRESVCGYASIGLETHSVTDKNEALSVFSKISGEDYAVVFITEEYASLLKDEIDKIKDNVTPSVILIPGVRGNTGQGMQSINDSVIRAIGSALLD